MSSYFVLGSRQFRRQFMLETGEDEDLSVEKRRKERTQQLCSNGSSHLEGPAFLSRVVHLRPT